MKTAQKPPRFCAKFSSGIVWKWQRFDMRITMKISAFCYA
jgi:hypothetical protein